MASNTENVSIWWCHYNLAIVSYVSAICKTLTSGLKLLQSYTEPLMTSLAQSHPQPIFVLIIQFPACWPVVITSKVSWQIKYMQSYCNSLFGIYIQYIFLMDLMYFLSIISVPIFLFYLHMMKKLLEMTTFGITSDTYCKQVCLNLNDDCNMVSSALFLQYALYTLCIAQYNAILRSIICDQPHHLSSTVNHYFIMDKDWGECIIPVGRFTFGMSTLIDIIFCYFFNISYSIL